MSKLILALVFFAVVFSVIAEEKKCYKMVNEVCGTETREVFVKYRDGDEVCAQEQYESGQFIDKEVCYHYGDIWCEPRVDYNTAEWKSFCTSSCCFTEVPESDKPKCQTYCNCGFKKECKMQQFPVMAYKQVCKPEQLAVYETKEFPKNCQTQVEVECKPTKFECGTNTWKEKCGTKKEDFECGTDTVSYQCGTEQVQKFDCYKTETNPCGTDERSVFVGYHQTNKHTCVQKEQYACGTTQRNVCTYYHKWSCELKQHWEEEGWCKEKCCSDTPAAECAERCTCNYGMYHEHCEMKDFVQMCYRDAEMDCYDNTPYYETKIFTKFCTVNIPQYKLVDVPKMCDKEVPRMCEREIDIFCDKSEIKWCCDSACPTETTPEEVPEVKPEPPVTPPGGPWKANAAWKIVPGMDAWCGIQKACVASICEC